MRFLGRSAFGDEWVGAQKLRPKALRGPAAAPSAEGASATQENEAAAEGGNVKSVVMQTRKPPASLQQAPFVKAQGLDLV